MEIIRKCYSSYNGVHTVYLYTIEEFLLQLDKGYTPSGHIRLDRYIFEWDDKYKRTANIGYPFVIEEAGKIRTIKEWVEFFKKEMSHKSKDMSDTEIATTILHNHKTSSGWEKV